LHITTTRRSGFLPAPIRMTLNDPEFNLKCALRTGRLTYVCCGFRCWPCINEWAWALTVSDKNVANKLRFQSIWGLYEFSPGFTAEGATNRNWGAKLGSYSRYAASSELISQIFWDVWPFLYSCTTGAVFSEVHDHWASQKKTCIADALTLCGRLAELLVCILAEIFKEASQILDRDF